MRNPVTRSENKAQPFLSSTCKRPQALPNLSPCSAENRGASKMSFDVKQAIADAVARHKAEFPDEPAGPATAPKVKKGTDRTRLNAFTPGLSAHIALFTDGQQKPFALH